MSWESGLGIMGGDGRRAHFETCQRSPSMSVYRGGPEVGRQGQSGAFDPEWTCYRFRCVSLSRYDVLFLNPGSGNEAAGISRPCGWCDSRVAACGTRAAVSDAGGRLYQRHFAQAYARMLSAFLKGLGETNYIEDQ